MKKHRGLNQLMTVAGFLAAGTLVPAAFGQSGGQESTNPPTAAQPGPGMHRHGERPFAGLNLSDDQKAQIKKIHQAAKTKAEAVMSDTSLSDADKQAKIKEIHRNAMMESEKVLTPEQQAQIREKRKERREEK
jgi:Spy/CpxP family protein refolding chaperone